MPHEPVVLPPRFLRTKEAATFLSLSARTLEKHRTYGTGPAYRKLGGRVVYAIDDLEAWTERGAVTSTVAVNGCPARTPNFAVAARMRVPSGTVPAAWVTAPSNDADGLPAAAEPGAGNGTRESTCWK